jgi:hypothetical protein
MEAGLRGGDLLVVNAQYRFNCTGVITGLTESFGIIFLLAAILSNSSFVAVSEFEGGGGVCPIKDGF